MRSSTPTTIHGRDTHLHWYCATGAFEGDTPPPPLLFICPCSALSMTQSDASKPSGMSAAIYCAIFPNPMSQPHYLCRCTWLVGIIELRLAYSSSVLVLTSLSIDSAVPIFSTCSYSTKYLSQQHALSCVYTSSTTSRQYTLDEHFRHPHTPT